MRSLSERFWEKVDKSGDCWLWTASRDTTGYGCIRVAGVLRVAHRVAFEMAFGATALELDHLCRVRACVNPSHLEPVTHAENMRRGAWARKTHCPRGHAYDETNTCRHAATGNRYCRECHNAAGRRTRLNRKVRTVASLA